MAKCDNISNFQIHKVLKGYPNFRGVFAMDMLPKLINKNECGVINVNRHWVAYCHNEKRSDYFDPFGTLIKTIPQKIVNYLRSRNKHQPIVYNDACIQSPLSQKCGCFAIKYIQLRQFGMSAENTLKQFTDSPSSYNELLALSAFSKGSNAFKPAFTIAVKPNSQFS